MKLALALALALLGCSKSDDKVASCLIESMQTCREYRGDNLMLGTESLQKLCTALVTTAKFSETPCPTAKRIGTCKMSEGTDFHYEGATQTAEELAATCTQSGGTFSK